MKVNRFLENKGKIKDICIEHEVDISVGASMYAQDLGLSNYNGELDEFMEQVRFYQNHATLSLDDFFIGGE